MIVDGEGVAHRQVPDVMGRHGRVVHLVFAVEPPKAHPCGVGIHHGLGYCPGMNEAAEEPGIEEQSEPCGQAQPGEHLEDWTCHIKHSGHDSDGTGVRWGKTVPA